MRPRLRGRAGVGAVIPWARRWEGRRRHGRSAENNGLAVSAPLMGWSTWSFLRSDPTAAKVEAEASALMSSGLSSHGYGYVNLDDFWYECPAARARTWTQYGRWVTDPAKFPARAPPTASRSSPTTCTPRAEVRPLRDARHLRAGRAQNTPIQGTSYTADRSRTVGQREQLQLRRHGRASTTARPARRRSSTPGRTSSPPGAWTTSSSTASAPRHPGRPGLVHRAAADRPPHRPRAFQQPVHLRRHHLVVLANGWRTTGDIECYCGSGAAAIRSPTGPTSRAGSPPRPAGSPTAVPAAGTTTTRSRSATAPTTASPSPSGRPRCRCGPWPARR